MEHRKLCARWHPRRLSTQNKNWHSEVALSYFSGWNKKEMSSWNSQWQAMTHMHHFNPQTKQFRKQWKCPTLLRKKKVCHSAGEFGASVFWNAGIIHTEFMPQGTITEMKTYYDILWCLHQAIHRRRIGHLSRDVILDNAAPHSTWAEEFCGHFNFLTIHHAVLTLSCQTIICLSYWNSTWEITDSTIWGCGNGYSQMAANVSLISTEMGFLHSHQDGINASVCSGIMLKNNVTSAE